MKRPFPRFEVLGLAAALAIGGACTPDNSVKPGAPVLIALSIVENPAAFQSQGSTITTVTASTGACPAATHETGACDPMAASAICEEVTSNNLCHCVANPTAGTTPAATSDAGASDAGTADAGPSDAGASHAPTSDASLSDGAVSEAGMTEDGGAGGSAATLTGTWTCSYAPDSVVLYTFDRLLDTAPLDPGDASTLLDLASFDPQPPPAKPVVLAGDYASTGAPNLLIFPGYTYRANGPSLLFAGVPTFPTSTTITVTLDKTKVLAKDGRTPFTATNLLVDGAISFVTQPLSVAVTTPPPPSKAADAGADAAAPVDVIPDMTAATATFNNIVCPQLADGTFDATAIGTHITVSATPIGGGGPTPVLVDFSAADGFDVTITPHTTWPANAMVSISVDANAADILGDLLGTAVTATPFTTSAM
jgi:hypothetical protein